MSGRPTWAEISLPRLRENFRAIRRFIGQQTAILAVVKANAYGHGAEEVSRALAAEGAAWFGVTCPSEALPLRRAGISQPILLLSGFWPGEEEVIAAERLTPAICVPAQLRLLDAEGGRRGGTLPFHLKVDTGMGRLGIAPGDVASFLQLARSLPHVCFEGLFTHLASADDEAEEQSRQQIECFERVLREVRGAGFHPPLVHTANSSGLARYPEARGNLVRPGLALYGYQMCPSPLQVRPVLDLKSRLLALRDVPAGTPLGYGATYVTSRPARIATVCAGYADGISRALSNRGHALVRGRPAPVVGRVSMDLTMLDVTACDGAAPGDEVVFIGRQGDFEVTAAQLASWAGTIPYEILCNIGPRVPRVYVNN